MDADHTALFVMAAIWMLTLIALIATDLRRKRALQEGAAVRKAMRQANETIRTLSDLAQSARAENTVLRKHVVDLTEKLDAAERARGAS